MSLKKIPSMLSVSISPTILPMTIEASVRRILERPGTSAAMSVHRISQLLAVPAERLAESAGDSGDEIVHVKLFLPNRKPKSGKIRTQSQRCVAN